MAFRELRIWKARLALPMPGFGNQLTSGWAIWLQHDGVFLSLIKKQNSRAREATQLLRM